MTGSTPKSVDDCVDAVRLLTGAEARWFQRLDARDGVAVTAVAAMTVTTTAMDRIPAPTARRLVNRLTIPTSPHWTAHNRPNFRREPIVATGTARVRYAA